MTRIFRSLRLTPLLSATVLAFIFLSAFTIASNTGGALARIASAATLDAPADPVATAQATPDAAWSMVELYGPIWGGALLLFGAAGAFLRRNESKHWIAQGRALAALTGGFAVLGAFLTWHFRGGDTAGLLMTLYGAFMAFLHPTVTAPVPTEPPKSSQAGFTRVGMMLMIAAAGVIIACATVKTKAESVAAGVVTCAKADKAAVQALGLKLGTEALAGFIATGKIPWDTLKADAEAGGEAQGIDIAACSFGGLLADLDKLLHPTPANAAAVRVAARVQGLTARIDAEDPLAAGRAALAEFQAAHGVTRIDQ